MESSSMKALASLLLGLVVGFSLASKFIMTRPREMQKTVLKHRTSGGSGLLWTPQDNDFVTALKNSPRPSNFIFIGVMTAQKYLNNRAIAAHRTWAQTVPGRLLFFSSEGSDTSLPLPVVPLQKVDDSYPPQKKSFMMLKYMHDHYLDQYEWFMRVDDDIYIHTERLESFLRSLNSSKAFLLGQTGTGAQDELDTLALEPGENFCMGGPGVVMSREVLRRMAPHISQCLREMHTRHEDVELGRCVRRFAGVQCVWSYEMQYLFYQNYEPDKKGFIEDLSNSKLYQAITLHPNKSPPHLYRLHSFMLSRKMTELQHRTIRLHREILQMSHLTNTTPHNEDLRLGAAPGFTGLPSRRRQEVLEWEFFTDAHLYSASDRHPPRRALSPPLKAALDDIIVQVMETLNANGKAREHVVDFKKILYGYRRVDALHRAEYILDLLLLYRRLKGPGVAVPVRRHAYLLQAFSRAFFREESDMDAALLAGRIDQDSGPIAFFHKSLGRLYPFRLGDPSSDLRPGLPRVNILVPLSGRYEVFVRFMANFEKVCLASKQAVKLLVLLFSAEDEAESKSGGAETVRHTELVTKYHRKYPWADIAVQPVEGPFSRGLALHIGSSHFSHNSLLFFCDVDLLFTADFLKRCSDNTIFGEQAYFPVIFSQYDPKLEGGASNSPYVFTTKTGLWRHYGFGIVCVYKGDLVRAGGVDVSIQGWGLEDVDLFNKFIQSGTRVFRSADPGIVHMHHPVVCDPQLDAGRYKMCLGSRASSYADTLQLAQLWLEKNRQGFHRTNITHSHVD
ncbi:chondroitin sulfate synthase 1-like [Anguilla rostrata]|uniref:chondroitin sulfate synthase 1-like n=1 Tax=Anguilla rostrata TaxID=7938 RepID=UPI0030CA9B0A